MIKISELSEQAQKDFEKIMKMRDYKTFMEVANFAPAGTPRTWALISHPEIGTAIVNEIRKQRRQRKK